MSNIASDVIAKKKAELGGGDIEQIEPYPTPQDAVVGQQNPLQTMAANNAVNPQLTTKNEDGSFNSENSRDNIIGSLKEGSDAYYANQKAQFDKMLSGQITAMEKAYNDAVANGELSVKDAQEQFEEQREELYETAYQQSESTGIMGNEMGIQNSQQMMGMRAGDNARMNKLHNSNVKDKDRRINDIRDRIKLIGQQKDLDMIQAQTDHEYNIAGAKGQADLMYSEKLNEFQTKDHFTQEGQQHDVNMADKEQGFTEKNMETQQGYTKDNMATEQQYTQENMDKQQGFTEKNMTQQQKNDLEKMKVEFGYNIQALEKQSALRIKEFGVQHDYDVKKMAVQLQNDIKMEAEKYGYQSKLMTQEHKNAMSRAAASASSKISQANTSYKKKVAAAKTPAAKKAVTTKHNQDMQAMYSQVVQQTTSDMLFAKAPNKDPKSAEYKKWADQQRSLNTARKNALAKLK